VNNTSAPYNDLRKRFLVAAKVSLSNEVELIDTIADAIRRRTFLSVGYANPHVILAARRSRIYAELLNRYDILHIDGVGVQWAMRYLYPEEKEVVNLPGSDLYHTLLKTANEHRWKVFLFGSGSAAVIKASEVVHRLYPSVEIVGARHGFDPVADGAAADAIRASCPDILFVGLGVPKQEEWIDRYARELSVPVCIAVGGAIDLFAGARARAPRAFIAARMEWLYRLFQEPGRLWRRYLLGIPAFVYYVVRQKLDRHEVR
jgi:exopolysaccharide biosynthesis WecB/TagA/CpsF family protein